MRKSKLYKGILTTTILKLINESHLLSASLLMRIKEFTFEGKSWCDLLLFARRNSFLNQYHVLDLVDVNAAPVVYQKLSCYFSDS